jgi:hypothetical protein
MSVVEIALTAEQLAAAYLQLNEQERRGFLEAVFSHPAQQHIALELLIAAQAVLKQKFSQDQQRLLDRLLDKNTEGELRPAEQKQFADFIATYSEGLVEKARARYILALSQRAAAAER